MFLLSEQEQFVLLEIARESVLAYLSGRPPHFPEYTSSVLSEPHGVFATLHKGTALRGCIGNIHPSESLARTVADCAIAAAVEDTRFAPLLASELSRIEFEISVLSPLQKVLDIRDIQVGRDGLMIFADGRHGLLLPQVAGEYGWDRERFLSETCRKAGLRLNDWKGAADIYRFTAFVFDERQLHERVRSRNR